MSVSVEKETDYEAAGRAEAVLARMAQCHGAYDLHGLL